MGSGMANNGNEFLFASDDSGAEQFWSSGAWGGRVPGRTWGELVSPTTPRTPEGAAAGLTRAGPAPPGRYLEKYLERFLETAEQHFMVGQRVVYYVFIHS